MHRRRLLVSISGCKAFAGGCLGRSVPDAGEPSNGTTNPIATATPCERTFESRAGETADCAGTCFEKVDSEPISTETTAPGQTPYEGTFDDYLEVRITTDAATALELRGCIEGFLDGSAKALPVTESLDATKEEYRFRFGPFAHPDGVDKYHLWIVGCEAEARGST